MSRTPDDEARIAAIQDQIRNAPSCNGPPPTLDDIRKSLGRLCGEIPQRLARIRLMMEDKK